MKDQKRHLFNKLVKRKGVGMKYKKSFGSQEKWSNAVNELKNTL